MSYNRSATSVRQAAEWGMQTLQGVWGRVRKPLSSDHQHIGLELKLMISLHQFRTRTTGINQIRSHPLLLLLLDGTVLYI